MSAASCSNSKVSATVRVADVEALRKGVPKGARRDEGGVCQVHGHFKFSVSCLCGLGPATTSDSYNTTEVVSEGDKIPTASPLYQRFGIAENINVDALLQVLMKRDVVPLVKMGHSCLHKKKKFAGVKLSPPPLHQPFLLVVLGDKRCLPLADHF